MDIDEAAALAWRWDHHGFGQDQGTSVVDIAERTLGARAWPLAAAEISFAVRSRQPALGAVERSLASGELLQSYAFRGGSYVFTPAIGSALLAVRTVSRVWETARWQGQLDARVEDWEPVREAICERLVTGPATRAEIADHLRTIPSLQHLAPAAETGAGADSLYKPLHWWGDIAFGRPREGRSTFRLLRADPAWPGLPDVDDAGRTAVRLYLGAYGPATFENLRYWLVESLSVPSRRLEGWLADLGPEVAHVDVGGVPCLALATTVAAMGSATPSPSIRLLPAFDPWIIGPGTADRRIVSPDRRQLLSTGRAPVLRGGVVVGTWRRHEGTVSVTWFDEVGPAPMVALAQAVEQLARAIGTDLTLA